jgi:hypothetical protein
MREATKAVAFTMGAATDQTGSFAINLDIGEIGALQVTARKVWLSQLGDNSRLKAIAASIRRHLNIPPTENPEPTPEPAPRKTLLVLCENSADAAVAQSLKLGQPTMAVITLLALEALKTLEGVEKIASTLRNRQIAGCLLIAASGEGPGSAVEARWRNLENAVQRNGVLDVVTLRRDGKMQVVMTNAARIALLDMDSASKGPEQATHEELEPDPDPW